MPTFLLVEDLMYVKDSSLNINIFVLLDRTQGPLGAAWTNEKKAGSRHWQGHRASGCCIFTLSGRGHTGAITLCTFL